MRKGLKITLIVLGILTLVIVLDTMQAKIFNNSPFIKIRKDFKDGYVQYVDRGLLVNHYYCKNKEEKTVWKSSKYACPIYEDNNLTNDNSSDERGLYKILDYGDSGIYSDEENPLFINDNEKESIKEFLPNSNCTIDCIHGYSNPVESNQEFEVYKYKVLDKTYYLIKCQKINSNYNNGKDILIGQDKDKLSKFC